MKQNVNLISYIIFIKKLLFEFLAFLQNNYYFGRMVLQKPEEITEYSYKLLILFKGCRMGKERAIKALYLEPTDKIPSCETLEHPQIISEITGSDPYTNTKETFIKAVKALDIDWLLDIPCRAVQFTKEETTKTLDDGRKLTEWGVAGSEWEDENVFSSVEEVLKYRPLEDTEGKVRVVSKEYRDGRIKTARENREIAGDNCLVSGMYYTTLFQFGIMSFGWENFLVAAGSEPEIYSTILDQFAEISYQNVSEWVKDDCPVFFFHDDLAITRGLVFKPEWYRKEIFPRYEKIIEPAKQAGKRIVFVSDGNYTELIDDIFAVGVDGIMVDCYNDLDMILKKYGEKHPIIGNIDTLILTNGSYEDIKQEVKRCTEIGKRYPGYFMKAAGDLPHNIPMENLKNYFKLKAEFAVR